MKKTILYGVANYEEIVKEHGYFVDKTHYIEMFELVWHVERSYPQGKSDLKFVGKYHEQFAGLRWVIEFKYYSNTKFKQFETSIADFQLQEEDTQQIAGYVEGLKAEYPEAKISQFVIYCFGNQGFRVFTVSD